MNINKAINSIEAVQSNHKDSNHKGPNSVC